MSALENYKSRWARFLRPRDKIQYGQHVLYRSAESKDYVPRTLLVVTHQQASAAFVVDESKKNPIERVFPLDEHLISCVSQDAQDFRIDFLVISDPRLDDIDDYTFVTSILSIKFDQSSLDDLLQAVDLSYDSHTLSRESESRAYLWLATYTTRDESSNQSVGVVDQPDASQATTESPRMMLNPFLSHDPSLESNDLVSDYEGGSLIRDQVLRSELLRREREYVEEQSILVKCSTWNMAGQELIESLRLLLGKSTDHKETYKLHSIAFQEIDSSSQAYFTVNDAKSKHYQKRIEQALGDEFEVVASHQLVGVFLCVYAHISIVPIISQIEKSYVACGVLGMVGNKGGVGIRFNVLNTSFAFISCHLAAGQDAIEKRNADFKTIVTGMFNEQGYWTSGLAGVDNLFLMGDLNYRITRSRQGVLDALASKDLKGLLLHDQLNQQKQKDRVLSEWQEGQINFQPTYKFDIGTDDYDTSEKQRVPAWTDRILTRSAKEHIELVKNSYKSVPEYYQSDHKPVVAVFEAKIRAILHNMQTLVETETQRMLDNFENELIPSIRLVSIDDHRTSSQAITCPGAPDDSLDFGSIRFSVPVQRSFIIRNTGHVPASFSFATEMTEDQMCKRYLWPLPACGDLDPGEELRVQLTILINDEEAQILNDDPEQLPKFLILHTKNGPDTYIPMSATWKPT